MTMLMPFLLTLLISNAFVLIIGKCFEARRGVCEMSYNQSTRIIEPADSAGSFSRLPRIASEFVE